MGDERELSSPAKTQTWLILFTFENEYGIINLARIAYIMAQYDIQPTTVFIYNNANEIKRRQLL